MEEENFKYRERILSFLQGKATPEEEEELLKWIKSGKKRKKRFLKEQESLRKKIVQTGNEQTDRQWERLSYRLFKEKNSVPPKTRALHQTRHILSVAAAFVVGIIIPGIIYLSVEKENRTGYKQPVQLISIPYGAKTNFLLPDGSMIWLNSGSKLSFPFRFGKERNVRLEGEAYFDVKKNGKPFIVSTNYGNIQVMGTSFDVKAYHDGEFQATLVKGIIRVDRTDSRPVILHPGEQSYLDAQGQLSFRKVDTLIFTSWKEGKLIFYREPFEKMARRLERWYNIKIEIDDKNMENLRFTGTIEMETLSELMDLICRTMPVKYTYDRDKRLLKIYKKGGQQE